MGKEMGNELPTLLFVEECESTLSRSIASNLGVRVVLLRFEGVVFSSAHLKRTEHLPCFTLEKVDSVERAAAKFRVFCEEREIAITHFFNDSEYFQERVQQFAWELGLSGALDARQSLLVRDKGAMKDLLADLGYRTMQYGNLTCIGDALSFAANHGGYPFIVKWRKGMSSKEVYRIESQSQLVEINLDFSKRRYIAETFCPDKIWCFDSLVQNGRLVGTFLTWLPFTNLSFAEKKDKFVQITVSEVPSEIAFDGREITQRIIDSIGLKDGYMQVEIFVTPEGQPIVCEFCWRTAGEHMLSNQGRAFGVDVCVLLTDIMVGRQIKPLPLTGLTCVGDMFLPIQTGLIRRISTYDELGSLDGVFDGEVFYKEGDRVEERRQYTSCAGWVQVGGATKEEVLKRMLEVYEKFILEVGAD